MALQTSAPASRVPSGTASKRGVKAPAPATLIGRPAATIDAQAAKLIVKPHAAKVRGAAAESSMVAWRSPAGTASKSARKPPAAATVIAATSLRPEAHRPVAKVITRPRAKIVTK
jgi:hypothetical protein